MRNVDDVDRHGNHRPDVAVAPVVAADSGEPFPDLRPGSFQDLIALAAHHGVSFTKKSLSVEQKEMVDAEAEA